MKRFRRAEGLWITVAPCVPDEVRVQASRQDEDARSVLPRASVRLLSRLSGWHTADELGVPLEMLTELVAANCAFWSEAHPDRVLTGAPLDALDGRVGLRRNVRLHPMIARGAHVGTIPHMPRLGELDDAVLAGVRIEIVEWETDVANVTFACCRRHAAALRDLIPRLDGRATVDELASGDDARLLLELLDDLGLLARHTPPAWDGAPRVTWLGHAGVLYEAAGRRVLIDPPGFAYSEPTRHAVRPFDLRDLGELDAVLITHGDADHLDPVALIRVARTTPIVVPSAAEPRPYHVDMARVLALLGFERVIAIDPWQTIELGEVTVLAAPFRGEDWGLDLPCRTYAVRGPGLTIYANADALTDDATCARLAAELAIDVAFVGVTGAAESHAMPPGYGYGHFYYPWIPAERHAEWVELCNGPRQAAACARQLGARFAFGYAAGGAAFYPMAYSDRGTHGELVAELEASPEGTRPITLELGVPRTIAPR